MEGKRIISPENFPSDGFLCDVEGLTQQWANGAGWRYIDEPRPQHGLMLIECGHATVRYADGGYFEAKQGDLLYIPYGLKYEIMFFETENRVADVQVNFMMFDLSGHSLFFSDRVFCLLSPTPQQIAKEMYQLAKTHMNYKNPTLQSTKLAYGLLESIRTYTMLHQPAKNRNPTIAPALLYVDSHIGDKIRVSELAKMCLVSESAFRKIFREQTGMSPARYKIHAKIEKACELLTVPDLSIGEISATVGFCDIAEFYKFFSEIVGKTPGQYREEQK